jgi:hypothetical protein
MSSTVSLNNGVQLKVSANLGSPTGEEQLTAEMAPASGDSFYRIFWDQNHLAVYAYELEVSLLPEGSALRAVAKPVETEFAARYPNADAGKPVPTLSADHAMGPLSSGQSATFDLFQIPGMGLNVSETVRVTFGAEESGALQFSGLRVFENGRQIAGPAAGSAAGRYAMFYLPGRGAFFFSIEGVPGKNFVKAGMIDRNRIRFSLDNVDYECQSNAPIHGQGGEVWVLHDASYHPLGNWTQDVNSPVQDQFFTAASDSLGWWLR